MERSIDQFRGIGPLWFAYVADIVVLFNYIAKVSTVAKQTVHQPITTRLNNKSNRVRTIDAFPLVLVLIIVLLLVYVLE